MSDVSRWYPSKIDWWVALALALAPLMAIAAMIALAATGGAGFLLGLAPVAFIGLIYGVLVFPMRYGITDDVLVVRYGLIRQRIALRDITEVSPTHNPMSSPALSLDRLRIDYGTGLFKTMMISPADKAGFLTELASKSGLGRAGERLVRA